MFWAGVFSVGAIGALYLQYLGPLPPSPPPSPKPVQAALPKPAAISGVKPAVVLIKPVLPAAATAPAGAPPSAKPAATPAATPAAETTPAKLLVIPPPPPQIAIMLAGLGYNATEALQAATSLPGAISFAVSPFGDHLTETEAYARSNGHELILTLPMQALLARAPAGQNQALLDWSFKRLDHFSGVTDAIGPAMGGGFMQDLDAKNWLLGNISAHGLYYVEGDASATGLGMVSHHIADIVIDPSELTQNETTQLASLVSEARSGRPVLGVVLNPTPAELVTLANWADTLSGLGIELVPVSALMTPPADINTSSLQ
jgi:polysaccharide deacetylase 2 family uncharacterized protein YibQ